MKRVNNSKENHSDRRYLKHFGTIPSHWRDATIGDLFHVQLGKMLSQKSKTGTNYRPYLGNWNVQWGRFDLSRVEEMDFDAQEFSKFELRNGDLLVCEGGEVGRTAIWRGEIVGCCYQKALHRLRPKTNEILPSYFLYYMEEATRQNLFIRFTNETSIAHLSRETLVEVVVPLPSPVEQQRIVAILMSIDAAIEATRAVIGQARKLKTGLLQDLLTNGLPGRHKRFRNDPKTGTSPHDWSVKALDELVEPQRPICYGILMPGQGYPGGIPVVKVKDIVDGYIRTESLLLTSPSLDEEYKRSRLEEGDLLLTIRGTTGRVAVVPKCLHSGNITQDTARVSINDNVVRDFVYYSLQGKNLQDQIANHTIGQAVKGINIGEVRKLQIPMPDHVEMVAIVGLLQAVDRRLRAERELLEQLIVKKSSFSQGLLTGRIPVSVGTSELEAVS